MIVVRTVMECSLCATRLPSLAFYISHLRLVHATDPNFSVKCGINHCSSNFKSFGGFNSHVYRHHRDALGLVKSDQELLDTSNGSADNDSDSNIIDLPLSMHGSYDNSCFQVESDNQLPELQSMVYDMWHLLGISQEQQKRTAASFLLKLREVCRVSEKSIGDIIDGTTHLFNQAFMVSKAEISDMLSYDGVDASKIQSIQLPNPFAELDTIYKQDKFFKEGFNYLEPTEIAFDTVYRNRFSGVKRQKVKSKTFFYYIPLYDTLNNLLQHSDFQRELSINRVNNHLIQDFCDGSAFKNHHLFSKDPEALQIIAYYDELEVTNPIGSYVHTHKLGCLFFSLGNIRPQYRSSLKSIYLVAVAKSQDITRYGIDVFLRPFVEDLKHLYIDGITVKLGPLNKTYHGALLAFLADTLAAHLVGGFKGSMSFAYRICRTCMITKEAAQTCYSEDDSQCELRTPERHEEQCQLLVGSDRATRSIKYGINRTSILEEVPGFSVVNGLPHDVMHDLFEGVVKYELLLFLPYCLSKGYFTITDLNSRLQGYDFGPEDKPSTFSLDDKNQVHIRQSAAQMISMVRNLPLLIADKIPPTDDNWYSLLLLIKICQIALSPVVTPDTVPYLRVLIEEKLYLLHTLYPESSLKPKMHYLIHLPSQIERHGPLIHSWTMRHEAKLSFIKRASRRGNFKNICFTVAKHHQLWLCYHTNCTSHLIYPTIECSPKISESCLRGELPHVQSKILATIPTLTLDCVLTRPTWLKCHSSIYRHGSFVLIDRDEMTPTFGKITDIIFVSQTSSVFFAVEVYKAECFSCHYNCFVIKSSCSTLLITIESLHDYHALMIHRSFDVSDSSLYISLPSTY